ncbi:hypothetical protein [Zhihengliuella halotolerans]|uniref:Uncharacterized protein n=1 Tax=Zhihengliuella halotolerans TaxID=370736 RepID=A0A4Q8ADL4_9MICC|nr:hypothetical protein [Zhihengliuella halotolerans]RZU61723.1 hypothetical protein EV380_1301 [Zhihengliuella halotolerans]
MQVVRPDEGQIKSRRARRVIMRGVRLSAIAGISAGLTLTTVGAAAPPGERELFSSETEKTVDASQTLVRGQLKDASGKRVDNGTVTVYAFPDDIDVAVGESFDLIEIGTAEVDSDGSYRVEPNFKALPSQAGKSRNAQDGPRPVNISIVGASAEGSTTTASTVWVESDLKSGHFVAEDLSPGAVQTRTSNLGGDTDSGDGAEFNLQLDAESAAQEATRATTTTSSIPSNCGVMYTNVEPVTVGQTSSTTNYGFAQKLTFESGATSTMGVALSYTGKHGSFSRSGTHTTGSGSSTTFPSRKTTGSSYLRTTYRYGVLRCIYQSSGTTSRYEYRPLSHSGGATTASASTPYAPSGYCRTYVPGSKFTQWTSSASTFSVGAKTSGAIGIDLSSRSGYTSKTKMDHSFWSASRKVCGTKGDPGAYPGLLVVKK